MKEWPRLEGRSHDGNNVVAHTATDDCTFCRTVSPYYIVDLYYNDFLRPIVRGRYGSTSTFPSITQEGFAYL